MTRRRRYSQLIRPALYLLDLFIISSLAYFFLTTEITHLVSFVVFWILLSVFFSFYDVYRYTKIMTIISLILKQTFAFILMIFSYLYIIDSDISFKEVLRYSGVLFTIFTLWRVTLHVMFKKYRIVTGSNYKQVVIIGSNSSTKKLTQFFIDEPGYGYKYMGFFSNKNEVQKLGAFEDVYDYILKNKIDEVYCSIKELSNEQMSKLIFFAENNLFALKLIPDNKYIYSKKLKFENYNLLPILSLSEIPLKTGINRFVKRGFDIVFSLLVIIFLLSWFTPLIALLIRMESKGAVFFKQLRYGADFNLFACYKFRSMTANNESDMVQAAKNDMRVTRIGRFIRRTSIDELPQFFNVLFGSMSVVGPRPLLLSHTNDYKNKIDKFMVRHTVKPGITGLAQVSGYRGNIETDGDMQNRVRYDVFYVENWSLILDFKIIIKTILNVIQGEEKAY